MTKLARFLLALSLLAAACSSSTSVGATSTTEAGESQAETSTDQDDSAAETATDQDDSDAEAMADQEADEEAMADDEAMADEEADDEAMADDEGSDAATSIESQVQAVRDADDWCSAARAVEDGTDQLDNVDFTNPDELKRVYSGASDLITAANRLAPDEIKADVETTVSGFDALTQAFEEAEWSFLDLDLSVLEDRDVEMEIASFNIEKYNFEECGIGSDPGEPPVFEDLDDGSEEDNLPVDGTIRDQAADAIVAQGFTQEEATCIVGGLDLSNPEALEDPAAIFEVFTECDIPLERLAELGG